MIRRPTQAEYEEREEARERLDRNFPDGFAFVVMPDGTTREMTEEELRL